MTTAAPIPAASRRRQAVRAGFDTRVMIAAGDIIFQAPRLGRLG
jgi:hypothetical protein